MFLFFIFVDMYVRTYPGSEMLGAEGVPKFRIFEHETELSRLKLHEISTWFPSNILVASWKYHPESNGLRNLNVLGCAEAVTFWDNKRAWSKQDTYSDRKIAKI